MRASWDSAAQSLFLAALRAVLACLHIACLHIACLPMWPSCSANVQEEDRRALARRGEELGELSQKVKRLR